MGNVRRESFAAHNAGVVGVAGFIWGRGWRGAAEHPSMGAELVGPAEPGGAASAPTSEISETSSSSTDALRSVVAAVVRGCHGREQLAVCAAGAGLAHAAVGGGPGLP